MEQETPMRKKLVRDVKREALGRMEAAARTADDFNKVVKQWNHLDRNRMRRERLYEIGRRDEEMLHWTEGMDGEIKSELNVVIPRPLEHEWWRQIIRGDFLDVIFDCPHQLHELTTNPTVYQLVDSLKDSQKEILYLWAIRLYSSQRIAAYRGQSDRNIRKVYATIIEGLRRKLREHVKSLDGKGSK